ncbi:cell division protein ZapE [Halothiobacillus neapolitanus]|uniref:AFG1-family ATPase n=1 Tax=Halothiobacillus neapolitanus (strain ATCC 23641 / DSM 15147 / CIP 104769 / NCIMB 8539 / c2) TaxID=555778 RepID=D0KX48_HALNC|nr:cell division protein ZapE [Halothiobacillus neapolitanus]ACX97168.1 AFG1-family ATPase [Halothiobacillus neapolitanus c2]TDN60304.1 cell division protein ZapE [Halothiobacillus neapolitanus]
MSSDQLTSCMQAEAQTRGFSLDAAQLNACSVLQTAYEQCVKRSSPLPAVPLLRRLLGSVPAVTPVKGVYLHGGVGRGKSFVMNAFFSCVPLAQKQRIHFHRFMADVHARLTELKGCENPLLRIARDIARGVRLLCLDEFHIADITDAMLIRGLMQGLFDHGVVVVITSNTSPDDLYRNGLQRAQFLPTIALLKQSMAMVPFDSDVDYRLAFDPQSADISALPEAFTAMAEGHVDQKISLEIVGRAITARCLVDGAVWFDFHELCTGARGKADYIELANRFHTICLSGVPRFDQHSLAQARRFMWLVDEFYDRGVQLIFPDAASTAHFDHADLLDGEFKRVLSRLAEMQSRTYVSRSTN